MAVLYDGMGTRVFMPLEDRDSAIAAISMEYGRTGGTSYYLIRIPRYTLSGKEILPKVALTAGDGGSPLSALNYARRENTVFVLNAGLFNTGTLQPQGQTIVDGVSVTNSPMTDDMGTAISDAECYPLCIDKNGGLSSPYPRSVDTANMIADGVQYAVTGWGQLLDNFLQCGTDKFNEIVHAGKYIRQCIGQYENGDYMVCTVDMARNGAAQNDGGMTYAELANLLMARGVKYAYALDGGGSCETVIGNRQINPIYEGETGRKVPTVIRFDVTA